MPIAIIDEWLRGVQPAQLFCQFLFIFVFALAYFSWTLSGNLGSIFIARPGRVALANTLGSLTALAAYHAVTWAVERYSGKNPLLLILIYVLATPPLYLVGVASLQIVVQSAGRGAIQIAARRPRLGAFSEIGPSSGPQLLATYLLLAVMALFGYQAAFRVGYLAGEALLPL